MSAVLPPSEERSHALSDRSSTYIFNPYAGSPTYHCYGRIRDETDVTSCGLVMYDGQIRYAATLPRDFAGLFAKPCRKCFPVSS